MTFRVDSHRLMRGVLAILALITVSTAGNTRALAQDMSDDMVGQNEKAWRTWRSAMTALEKEKPDDAAKMLDEVAKMDLSPLRLALMADRTGTLRFEQAVASNKAGESGKKLLDQITAGRKEKTLAEDGWHFAAIGRFELANANFKALVDTNPDPVALLELARYNPKRHEILVKLMTNTDVGPSARAFLDILALGEDALRKDPFEISVNIERLGGTPRMVYNATNNLKASGEYAVPHLIRYLQDAAKEALKIPIIKLLPQLGRGAVTPMAIALDMKDQVTKLVLIEALGDIGYRQALPYLARLADGAEKGTSSEVQAAALKAMRKIDSSAQESPAALFLDLAEAYHYDADSVRADPRLNMANIWYFRDGKLVYIPVPREIFADVMAMRCCESALNMNADSAKTTALWLASNFRREARLGLNVESEEGDPKAARDATRPDNYPRSIYFARSAGPLYNHLVLARAVHDRDPGVALGSIAALAATAGEASMVGSEDAKQPLVEALSFPNRLVRVKTALAIGRTLPISDFNGSHNVMPVMNEALTLSTHKTALVVDPDDSARNKAQAVLRAGNIDVVQGAHLNAALDSARDQKISNFDLVILGSNIAEPDLNTAIAQLRQDFVTGATPILVVAKRGQIGLAQNATRVFAGVAVVPSDIVEGGNAQEAATALMDRYRMASGTFGMVDLSEDVATQLAMEAAEVLRMLAVSNSRIIEFRRAEPALITVLNGKNEALRIKAASVLARIDTPTAQSALAGTALDSSNSKPMRVAAFASLAEGARTHGNKLDDATVNRIIEMAKSDKDLTIRTACSQALGALNLPSNRASEIIRAQAQG